MADSPSFLSPLERVLYLKSMKVFAGLPASALAALAENARERSFRRGARIYVEGERVTSIFAIVDGEVIRRARGRDLGRIAAGAPLGAIPLLSGDEKGIEAIATRPTMALELPGDLWFEVLEDHFPLLQRVLMHLSRMVIDLRNLIPNTAGFSTVGSEIADAMPDPLTLVERIMHLRQLPIFQRSSVDALAELASMQEEKRFPAGETLWHQGEVPGDILLLVAGSVRCTTKDGKEFMFGAHTALGGLDSLAQRERWFTAVTATPVVALKESTEVLLDVFEDNFEMARDFMATLAEGVIALVPRAPIEAGRTLELAWEEESV